MSKVLRSSVRRIGPGLYVTWDERIVYVELAEYCGANALGATFAASPLARQAAEEAARLVYPQATRVVIHQPK